MVGIVIDTLQNGQPILVLKALNAQEVLRLVRKQGIGEGREFLQFATHLSDFIRFRF